MLFKPAPGNAPWIQLAFGVRRWWTAEPNLEGATMHNEGSAFTGSRLENRFRVVGLTDNSDRYLFRGAFSRDVR